ncbi:hypothetical protein BGZ94_006379 [Podila epigama]|nr:hypothetical protein BGZ94_006379 [Podila epigama]
MNDGHSSMTTTTNDGIMTEETAVVTKTLFSALQNHLTLQAQARREQDVLVENVNQLLRAKSMLLNNVVHQHSATAQPCFEPRNVQEAKEDLVERIQSARQECTKLEDQMNKEMIR